MKYFFVLGRNPTLSVFELLQLFHLQRNNYHVTDLSDEVVVTDLDREIKGREMMSQLGGTIKIGRILKKMDLDAEESKFLDIFSAVNFQKIFLPQKRAGKLHFALSIYNGGADNKVLQKLAGIQKNLLQLAKDNLKAEGIKCGFVGLKNRFLSSVSVVKNRLLSDGVEVVLIATADSLLIGKTDCVQDFSGFSKRDYDRPFKDKRSGIMPPKLARMMINLAGKSNQKVIIDPFCGSGTVLQEAVILGYNKLIGTDINPKAIGDTEKNLNWLFGQYPALDRSSYKITVKACDVRLLESFISAQSIDIVITEPYLGQPLHRSPDEQAIQKIFFELEKIYFDAFNQFYKILKPNGVIIIIFPAFMINKKYVFLPILDKIKKIGFQVHNLLPIELKDNPVASLTDRASIIYGSEGQFLHREILCFIKS